jgi:hypothetical protein
LSFLFSCFPSFLPYFQTGAPLLVYTSVRTLLQMGALASKSSTKLEQAASGAQHAIMGSLQDCTGSQQKRAWSLSPLLAKNGVCMPPKVMAHILSFVLIHDERKWLSVLATMPHFNANLQVCR